VEFARKIPLATWFRWRAALERTRTSLVVLSPACGTGAQVGCAGSSAELVVRIEAGMPAQGTVMGGVPYRLEVVRRRFEEIAETNPKKCVRRASAWESHAVWGAS
jgi:recombination protein RecA